MATIKFTTNLHPFQNGGAWQFHPNFFEGKDANGNDVCNPVPNEAGVYIVGVKIPVSDPPQFDENGKQLNAPKNEKFCPLYVGIRDNLKSRIKSHQKYNGYLNGKKELFDLSQPIKQIYQEILLLNYVWMKSKKKNADKNWLNKYMPNLIWFNSNIFFNEYLGLSNPPLSTYVDNQYWHRGSLSIDLPNLPNSNLLIDKINNTKKIIFENFYYAYYEFEPKKIKLQENADYNTQIKPTLEKIESATKWKLMRVLNIPTYADIHGAGKKIWKDLDQGQYVDIDIDLTDIKNVLVNMTGQPFKITTNNQNEQVFII